MNGFINLVQNCEKNSNRCMTMISAAKSLKNIVNIATMNINNIVKIMIINELHLLNIKTI